jgi:hypothetical protein
VLIDDNTIREIGLLFTSGGFGINVFEGVSGGTTNATIKDNTIDQVRDNRGMRASITIIGGTMCTDVSGNTFSNIDLDPQLRQTSGTHNNNQASEAALEAANFGQNFSISGIINFNQGTCTQP